MLNLKILTCVSFDLTLLGTIITRVGGEEKQREQTPLNGAVEGREGNGKLKGAKNRPQLN